jgi:hypothetical protein
MAVSPTSGYVLEELWVPDCGEEFKQFYHRFYTFNPLYDKKGLRRLTLFNNLRLAIEPHMRAKGFESDNNDCATCRGHGIIEGIKCCEACVAKWRPIEREDEIKEDHRKEAPESSEEAEEDREKKEPNPTQLVMGVRAKQEGDKRKKKKGTKGKWATLWAPNRR